MTATAPRNLWQALLRSTSLTRRADLALCYACCEAGPSRISIQSRSLHTSRRTLEQPEAASNSDQAAPLPVTQPSGVPSRKRSRREAQAEGEQQLTSTTTEQQLATPSEVEPWRPNFSMSKPPRHVPRPGGRPVCNLTLRSYGQHLSNLTFYTSFAQHAAHAFGLPASLPGALPIKTSLRTVPRSPFVHKPSQENFVKKEHGRYFKIYDAPLERVRAWLGYLHENGLDGVMLKTDMYEYKEVGFGTQMNVEASMQEGQMDAVIGDKVKQLAADLLAGGLGQSQAQTTEDAEAEDAETPPAEEEDIQSKPE